MNHKRKRPKHQRAGCACKPKDDRLGKLARATMQERKAREAEKAPI